MLLAVAVITMFGQCCFAYGPPPAIKVAIPSASATSTSLDSNAILPSADFPASFDYGNYQPPSVNLGSTTAAATPPTVAPLYWWQKVMSPFAQESSSTDGPLKCTDVLCQQSAIGKLPQASGASTVYNEGSNAPNYSERPPSNYNQGTSVSPSYNQGSSASNNNNYNNGGSGNSPNQGSPNGSKYNQTSNPSPNYNSGPDVSPNNYDRPAYSAPIAPAVSIPAAKVLGNSYQQQSSGLSGGYKGPQNLSPPPSECAAALICVPETRCSVNGIISDTPVILTKDLLNQRVALSDCSMSPGVVGKCCRDPLYKDPWPQDLPHPQDHNHDHGNDGGNRQRLSQQPSHSHAIAPQFPPLQSAQSQNVGTQQGGYGQSSISQQASQSDYGSQPFKSQPQIVPQMYAPSQQFGQQQPQIVSKQETAPGHQVPVQSILSQQQHVKPTGNTFPVGLTAYSLQFPTYQQVSQVTHNQQHYMNKAGADSGKSQYAAAVKKPVVAKPFVATLNKDLSPKPMNIPLQRTTAKAGPGPGHFDKTHTEAVFGGFDSNKVSVGRPQQTSDILSSVHQSFQGQKPSPIPTFPQAKDATNAFVSATNHQQHQPTVQNYDNGAFNEQSVITSVPPNGLQASVSAGINSAAVVPQNSYSDDSSSPVLSHQQPVIYSSSGAQQSQQNFIQSQEGCGIQNENGFVPWYAAVYSLKTSKVCGGTIIANNMVLTAAHCLDNIDSESVQVKIGPNLKIYAVHAIVRHPSYDSQSYAKDLTLLILKESIPFDSNVHKVCLPESTPSYSDYKQCFVASSNANGGDVKKIYAQIFSYKDCNTRLKNTYLGKYFILNDGFSCVSTPGDSDLCQVKFGEPLFCDKGSGRYELYGVKSWDLGCQEYKKSSIFSSNDVAWIYNVRISPLAELKSTEQSYASQRLKGENLEGVNLDEKPGFALGYGRR